MCINGALYPFMRLLSIAQHNWVKEIEHNVFSPMHNAQWMKQIFPPPPNSHWVNRPLLVSWETQVGCLVKSHLCCLVSHKSDIIILL